MTWSGGYGWVLLAGSGDEEGFNVLTGPRRDGKWKMTLGPGGSREAGGWRRGSAVIGSRLEVWFTPALGTCSAVLSMLLLLR